MRNSSTPTKQGSLRGWIKRATSTNTRKMDSKGLQGRVFGIPLNISIKYAKTYVGYIDDDGIKHAKAGTIPIVVAKCGSYLKKYSLETEGIFRISGSYKRINDLECIFDQGLSNYGLDLNWDGYTVHDAASVLRRYLNKLPDPVIPFAFYGHFRDVMNDREYNTTEHRIEAFQRLIQSMPPPHQHLLLYLLDTLHLFSSYAFETKMNVSNLAAVFCPSILRHPDYNTPIHYKITQYVIEFLIEFQSLFTMQLLIPKNRARPSSLSSSLGEPPPVPLLLPSKLPSPPLPIHQNQTSPRIRLPTTPSLSVHSRQSSITPVRASLIKSVREALVTPSTSSSKTSFMKSSKNPIQTYSPELSTPLKDKDDSDSDDSSIVQKPTSSFNINNTCQKISVLDITAQPCLAQLIVGLLIGIFVINLIVILYEMYLAYTLYSYEPLVFFLGFISYWYLLYRTISRVSAINTSDATCAEDMFSDIVDIELETLLQDEHIKSTWHGLLTRSWKSNESLKIDHETISIMSKSSRFDEVDEGNISSSEDEEEDLGFDPDLLTTHLNKYYQIKKDEQFAKRLQVAEQKARDMNNPFVQDQVESEEQYNTLLIESKEEWKITRFRRSDNALK